MPLTARCPVTDRSKISRVTLNDPFYHGPSLSLQDPEPFNLEFMPSFPYNPL